jgi:hypothetical protein
MSTHLQIADANDALLAFSGMADLSRFTRLELRAIATRALSTCCDECRLVLRQQLQTEEFELVAYRDSPDH